MLLIFLQYLLSLGIKVPALFFNFSTRMILASATGLLITIFLGPKFIKKLYELKVGQSIRGEEECPLLAQLHKKKKDTPTMGGVLILFSMTISLFLWMNLTSIFTILLLFTTLFLGILGARDDYLKLKHKNAVGLNRKKKFFFQIVFSSFIAVYLLSTNIQEFIQPVFTSPKAKEFVWDSQTKQTKSITLSTKEYITRLYIPFVKDPIVIFKDFSIFLAFLFILFVITGTSNAVNLTDGLDGLASGCLIMVSLCLGAFAFLSNHYQLAKYLNILYIEGSGEIAVFLLTLAGSCLGFLWFNGYPAQIFMGDTGSLALGGVIGVCSVLIRREFLLALVGIIFVSEVMSVILQILSYRFRKKKRIFLCAPLHHHFEYKGWPETKIVMRFWIVALFFAIIGIASLKFQ